MPPALEQGRTTAPPSAEAAQAPALGCTLSVRILDQDGAPIPGARVRTSARMLTSMGYADNPWWSWAERLGKIGQSSMTDQDGRAEVSGVTPDESLLLGADASGFARATRAVQTAGDGDTADLGEMRLGPAQIITVHVQDTDGLPVPGFDLGISVDDLDPIFRALDPPDTDDYKSTDETGNALVDHLPLARLVRIGGDEIVETRLERDISPRGGTWTVIVEKRLNVRGTVLDAAGAPIAGARMQVESGWDGEEGRPYPFDIIDFDIHVYRDGVPTDAQGRFELSGARPGKRFYVTAYVEPDLYLCSDWCEPGQEAEVRAPRLVTVTGRVQLEGQADLTDGRVEFEGRQAPNTPPERLFDLPDYYLERQPALCAADGSFSARISPGYYALEVHIPGGRGRFDGPYHLEVDGDLGTLVLQPGVAVVLIARDKASGEAIPGLSGRGAHILPRVGNEQDVFGGLFDREVKSEPQVAGSQARWKAEQPGKHRYVLEAPGYVPAGIQMELDAGDEPRQEVVNMERSGAAEVTVLDRNGKPARDTELRLAVKKGTVRHHGLLAMQESGIYFEDSFDRPLDPNGRARFKDLAPGIYTIHALNPKMTSRSRRREAGPALGEVEVVSAGTAEATVTLDSMAEVLVLVTDSGAPVQGAPVAARLLSSRFGSEGQVPLATTDEKGWAELPSLAPGRYMFGAAPKDGEAWTLSEQELSGGQQAVGIELATGALTVVFTGLDGGACSVDLAREGFDGREQQGARAVFLWMHSNQVWYGSASLGAPLRVTHLMPGRYRLRAHDREDWVWQSDFFVIGSGTTDLGTVALQRTGRLHARFTGLEPWDQAPGGRDIFGPGPFFVHIRAAGSEEVIRWETVREGAVEFAVPEGRYILDFGPDLRVKPPLTSSEFEVRAGETLDYPWDLPPPQ